MGPDFLIVGAMKSGTTTLAYDLERSKEIAFPAGKEVKLLASNEFDSDDSLIDAYFKLLGSSDSSLLGDASPQYTMGDTTTVAVRAKRYLKQDLKLICILRNPIDRAISHYKHLWQWTRSAFDSTDEAFEDPLFIETSMYARKLKPWIDRFGKERFRVIRFEDYIKDRKAELSHLFDFLGVESIPAIVDTETVLNSSRDRYVLGETASRVRNSLRALGFSQPLRPGMKRLLLTMIAKKAPQLDELPSKDTLYRMRDQFQEDVSALQTLCGDKSLTWDLDASVEGLLSRSRSQKVILK